MYRPKVDLEIPGRAAAAPVKQRKKDAESAGKTAREVAAQLGDRGSGPLPAAQSVVRLQQQYGNRYVQRVLAARREQGEAELSPKLEAGIRRERGGGQALDSGVRAQMEPALGADFGGVRVHHDAPADSLSRALGARAFATGRDVFFRRGAYRPGSSSGRELLAHELTHVVQQRGAEELQTKLTVGAPGDRFEQEADRVAGAWTEGERHAAGGTAGGPGLARQAEEEGGEETVQTRAEGPGLLRQEAEESEEAVRTRAEATVLRQEEEESEETARTQVDGQVRRQEAGEGEETS